MQQGPDLSALIAEAAEVWACLTSYTSTVWMQREIEEEEQ